MTKEQKLAGVLLRAVSRVVHDVIEYEAHTAVKYMSDRGVVKATQRIYKYNGKPDRNKTEILLTIGKPNYSERKFIKLLKKAGEKFPVQGSVLKFPPKKRK